MLSRAFYPFLARRLDKHGFYAKLNMSIAIIEAVLIILVSPWVIRLILGKEFNNSIIVMQILSASIVFLAMSFTYGTSYLIIIHKEKPLRNLTFASSIIGMCLIFYYSYIGAAITVLICRGMLGIGSFLLARKYSDVIKTK